MHFVVEGTTASQQLRRPKTNYISRLDANSIVE